MVFVFETIYGLFWEEKLSELGFLGLKDYRILRLFVLNLYVAGI
jgi:hypothetical protein